MSFKQKLASLVRNIIIIGSVYALFYMIIADVLDVYGDDAIVYAIAATIVSVYLYRKHEE